MNEISLKKITVAQQAGFKKELSAYLDELGVGGEPYLYFENYWAEENRIPLYFFWKNEKVGFALINDYCILQKGNPKLSIAEFSIFPKYRRQGLGQKMAIKIFETYHGFWEIRTLPENVRALLFWENTISKFVPSFYKNLSAEQAGNTSTNWDGTIFCF